MLRKGGDNAGAGFKGWLGTATLYHRNEGIWTIKASLYNVLTVHWALREAWSSFYRWEMKARKGEVAKGHTHSKWTNHAHTRFHRRACVGFSGHTDLPLAALTEMSSYWFWRNTAKRLGSHSLALPKAERRKCQSRKNRVRGESLFLLHHPSRQKLILAVLVDHFLTLYTRIKSKCINDLNIKLPEGNTCCTLCHHS